VLEEAGVASGVVGSAYSQHINSSGSGALSYAVVSGTLPNGLTLGSDTGDLTGTPTAGGESVFVVRVSNTYGSDTKVFNMTVHTPPTVTTSAISAGTVRKAYSAKIAASGEGALSYTMSAGSLPAGLKLNTTTGAITGTPSASGKSTFTITVVNEFGSASKTYSVVVAPVKLTASVSSGKHKPGSKVVVTVKGLEKGETATIKLGTTSYGKTTAATSTGAVKKTVTLKTNLTTKTYTFTVTASKHGTAKATAKVVVKK